MCDESHRSIFRSEYLLIYEEDIDRHDQVLSEIPVRLKKVQSLQIHPDLLSVRRRGY